MEDKFELGKCSYCGEHKALKNGKCVDCGKKIDFSNIFGNGFDFSKLSKEGENK